MKYEVNFIGVKPAYLGRSQFHRGFPKKRSEADLTGEPSAFSLEICVICVICGLILFILSSVYVCVGLWLINDNHSHLPNILDHSPLFRYHTNL